MDTVNKYLKRTLKSKTYGGFVIQDIRPYIECTDGFRISVQASENHYCSPRVNGDVRYDEVELGFPSIEESLIMEYAEDPVEPTNTVYGNVPIEVVNKVIEKHGGIVN